MKTFEIDCVEITESYDRDTRHVAYASDLAVANKIILDRPEGARPYLRPSKFKKMSHGIITIFSRYVKLRR